MPGIAPHQIEGRVIAYSEPTYANVDSPFTALDNRANLRPDWQEYWPIRNYLLGTQLQEESYYGFLSPRYKEKTGLSAAYIHKYLQALPSTLDVIIFSPQPDMGAFFKNIFDQNELFDQGFKEASQNFCRFCEIHVDLENIIMDSRNIIFSNYFFAKPVFWRRWLELGEVLFGACEHYPRIAQVNGWLTKTSYRQGIERKVFLMERLASLILSTEPRWKTHAHNPFQFAYSASRLNNFPGEAIQCDALKIGYNTTGNSWYLQQFNSIIEKIKSNLDIAAALPHRECD